MRLSAFSDFVQSTEKLYGKEYIRINLHQMLHLVKANIELWGLLWTHSEFVFESMNGFLTQIIHGTQSIPTAAIHTLSCLQSLPLKEKNVHFTHKDAQLLFLKLQKETVK
jgi:hypothetical protein